MDTANPAYMRALIAGLQDQMRLALSADVRFPVESPRPYSGILVLGMGGSGIGGAVMLRTSIDHPRTRHRMDITAEIFQEQGADVLVVETDGDTPWAELLDAVWVGDWMSLVLAERSGVCPVDIRFIDRLKTTLAKLP